MSWQASSPSQHLAGVSHMESPLQVRTLTPILQFRQVTCHPLVNAVSGSLIAPLDSNLLQATAATWSDGFHLAHFWYMVKTYLTFKRDA